MFLISVAAFIFWPAICEPIPALSSFDRISWSNFERIQIGMTESEFEGILGRKADSCIPRPFRAGCSWTGMYAKIVIQVRPPIEPGQRWEVYDKQFYPVSSYPILDECFHRGVAALVILSIVVTYSWQLRAVKESDWWKAWNAPRSST